MKIIDTDKYRFFISIVSYFIFNKNKDQTRNAPYCDHFGQYYNCFPPMLTLYFLRHISIVLIVLVCFIL